MERFIEKFNQNNLGLKPGESRVVYDSKNEKTQVVLRTKAKNMVEDIHEVMKKALEQSGIEIRE